MITDKDTSEARELGSVAAHCFNYRTGSFQVGDFNKQAAETISRIRAESAEQARKEAAECTGCWLDGASNNACRFCKRHYVDSYQTIEQINAIDTNTALLDKTSEYKE